MIKIKKLKKAYGTHTILQNLSLKIPAGKKTTIIGQSGCGKSTLLRLILGLEKFDEGELWVGDDRITELPEDDLNKVRLQFGMVFQSAALFDSMTVGENVGLVLKEHTDMTRPDIKERVQDKLNLVGLNDTYDQYPADLSGGMKKRVAFARAIVNDPKVILFDEPTTGLDPITSTRVENLINKITKKTKATCIVVTHQISTILNVSQNIIMIHNGKAIKTEGPKNIMNSENKMVYSFVNGLIK